MVKCEEEESGMSDKNLYSKRKWCVIQAKIPYGKPAKNEVKKM